MQGGRQLLPPRVLWRLRRSRWRRSLGPSSALVACSHSIRALTASPLPPQEHLADHLHDNIVRSGYFPDMEHALKDGFLRTDADFLQQAMQSQKNKDLLVGSAAAVVIATGQQVVVAHAGDCRVLLVKREGAARPFIELTRDHSAEEAKPGAGLFRPDEAHRVAQAGAKVADGFVNVGDRTLPMTRAFGNLNLKVADGEDWRCDDTRARTAPAWRRPAPDAPTPRASVWQVRECVSAGRDGPARGEHSPAQRRRPGHRDRVRRALWKRLRALCELRASRRHRTEHAPNVRQRGRRREQDGSATR